MKNDINDNATKKLFIIYIIGTIIISIFLMNEELQLQYRQAGALASLTIMSISYLLALRHIER